jgi:hypothetical protein
VSGCEGVECRLLVGIEAETAAEEGTGSAVAITITIEPAVPTWSLCGGLRRSEGRESRDGGICEGLHFGKRKIGNVQDLCTTSTLDEDKTARSLYDDAGRRIYFMHEVEEKKISTLTK